MACRGVLGPVLSWALLAGLTAGVLELPAVPTTCLIKPGDLNLGLLTGFLYPGVATPCDASRFYPYAYISLQYYEAFRRTVERVNARADLLPNVTLGYAIHDGCWSALGALAKAQLFIPCAASGGDSAAGSCPVDAPFDAGSSTCASGPRRTRVVGVVDPPSSPESHLVAPLLGLYNVPVLSTQATHDDLSDKARFEYFSRLVPPDGMLIDAMFDFIEHFNWTYISVLYGETEYGENAAKVTMHQAKRRAICVPVFEHVPVIPTPAEIMSIANKLMRNRKARIVIHFVDEMSRIPLLDALDILGLRSYFVFVSGDLMFGSDDGPAGDGAIAVFPFIAWVPEFETHIKSITPDTHGGNPWVMAFWEYHFDCQWETVEANNSCEEFRNRSIDGLPVPRVAQSLYMDAVLAYAYALHDLMEETCPEVLITGEGAQACVTGEVLLRYMRNVSFAGHNGIIEFDEKGDRLGKFSIQQYHHASPERYRQVAFWDKQAGVFEIYEDAVKRPSAIGSGNANVNNDGVEGEAIHRYVVVAAVEGDAAVPMSVCSLPCGPKQYPIQLELPCCWQCITCPVNHRLNENQTACEPCTAFTWPDDATGRVCEPITPFYLDWAHPTPFLFATLGVLGLLAALGTALWLFHHRRVKLIKACSVQMTGIVLTGVIFGSTTTFAYLLRPSNTACMLSKLSFSMSDTLMFVPLLVKTIRIYRLFRAGQSRQRSLAFTSNRVQVLITSVLTLIQLCLFVLTELVTTSSAELHMRIQILKEVELFCHMSLAGFLPPVTFNLLLLLLCALFGFLVRKLPHNFNEFWYLYVCVSTTLFLWVVFLPTYFTTYYAVLQVVLLVSCLLINTAVTHVCIFLPKM